MIDFFNMIKMSVQGFWITINIFRNTIYFSELITFEIKVINLNYNWRFSKLNLLIWITTDIFWNQPNHFWSTAGKGVA